jgi:Flp pilus assembly protein TadG
MLRVSPLGADTPGIEIKRTSRERNGRRGARELGQAMVEFALIAPLFLLIVVGIIQFGIALNYWLDLQKLSGQGARWAAVNRVPGCTNTTTLCNNPSLQQYVARQKVSGGNCPTVAISFPAPSGTGGTNVVGDPVKVTASTPFKILPVLKLGTLNLTADATMRMEQLPQVFAAGSAKC